MKRQGMLAVVSGFSGAGKGTVMKALLEKYENYALSISATTRAPRPGEQDGREYFFMTDEQFEELIQNDRLIEHARYVNHYYGTPRSYVESKMAEGKDVILEIEIQGALNVKKQYPDAILIFVVPPTAAELKRRLVSRGTETEEVIASRLKRALEESEEIRDPGCTECEKAVPGRHPDLRGAAHSRRAEAEAGEPRNRDRGSDRQPFKTGPGGIRGNGGL